MDIFKIAGKDLKSIAKNKFLIISIVAIIVVPMLYSLLYLDAFWDPYAKLEDVPVAVVNEDNGAVLDGKKVNYGNDILDELKNNEEVGWKITDEKTAEDGLEGSKYYAVVKIPEGFSKDVIAAKEGRPKTATISFTCNDKKNFLAAQINSKVQSEFKANVTASITSNYVDVAFDNLYKAKDGMKDAADGSTKLKDGIGTLSDKIPAMTTGIDALYKGSNELTSVQSQLNGGINTLKSGAAALNDGASALNSGASQVKDGVAVLESKVPELTQGVGTLASGSKTLLDSYTNKVLPGISNINGGLNALNTQLNNGEKDITALSEGSKQLQGNIPALQKGASDIKAVDESVIESYNQLIEGAQNLNSGIKVVAAGVAETTKEVENIGTNVAAVLQSNPQLMNDPNMQAVLSSLNNLNAGKEQGQAGLQQLVQGGDNLVAGVNTFNQQGLQTYMDGVSEFADKTSEFATGTAAMAKGTDSLIGSVAQIKGAVGQLSSGTNELYNNMILTNKDGFGYGLASVSQGNSSLNSKLPELQGGINQLSTGTSQLKDGSQSLLSGTTSLLTGAKDLQSGSSAILEGQVKLNNGIADLNSSIPELTKGVTQLKDGSTELSTKLSDGAKEMKDGLVNSSTVMGDYVANPVKLDNSSVNPVPNYGTGFAPYFIPLSLWIGAIMMFFVVPMKVSKEEEEASRVSKVVGKFITFSIVGILQALLVSFIVLGFLGLKPVSTIGFIGTNIFLSLVFVAIVQCLILLLGDAGRLISIVFLILQLTGCGGTFPLEVVPKFFRVINPFMPFTYAVEALREVISATSINSMVMLKDFGILALIMVVFLIICVIFRDKGEKLSERITAAR